MNKHRLIGIILVMTFIIGTVTGCAKPENANVIQNGNAIYYNVGNAEEKKEDIKDSMVKDEELKWWQETIVYEAYPSSFKDNMN